MHLSGLGNMKKAREQRTWYGVNAVIMIGPGFIHKAGVGKLLIPHPPIVNWLLRRGLPEKTKVALGLAHEFAHFQTAPVALPYIFGLLAGAIAGGHSGVLQILVLLISTHATWEMMSEMWTIGRDRRFYRDSYAEVSPGPRIFFWLCTAGLTLAGWAVFLF